MNSFELNKIALAILLVILLVIGLNSLADAIFEEDEHTVNAYPVEMEEKAAGTAVVAAVDAGPSLADMLASASVDKGTRVFKKCKACHTSDKGGKNLVGPNLWNIVGRAKGGLDSYSYSSAMMGKGGDWSYEDLDAFLKKPGKFIAKTKMSFAGLKKPADRAAVIALMRMASDAPVDMPAVATGESEVPEAAVEEAVPEEAALEE